MIYISNRGLPRPSILSRYSFLVTKPALLPIISSRFLAFLLNNCDIEPLIREILKLEISICRYTDSFKHYLDPAILFSFDYVFCESLQIVKSSSHIFQIQSFLNFEGGYYAVALPHYVASNGLAKQVRPQSFACLSDYVKNFSVA